MSIFKCKMCGGTIEFEPGSSIGVCDSCGTRQTLPKTDDGVITNLFNRANNLRLKCEFDKAEQIYEKIVEQDDSEAEAHWGIVLCKYGIEYVEDPRTGKRLPTCHRTLFDAVTTDPDYQAAVDYADAGSQAIYESEARAIDRIQKDILAIVKNEKPFDVFICYKETDENGKRTMDSAIANDIYYQLTNEGFKVFYAAITLEDKLGQEYEPYIFAALNSAKVMLVVGTKSEYFNAVWVKNEWSRFMGFMKTDRSRLLIPCYRDMDAYDLPEEFAHLQAQDMGKIGFINDLVRGIKKTASRPKEEPIEKARTANSVRSIPSDDCSKLLKRLPVLLEDHDFSKANECCNEILDYDPENAEAFLGMLLIELGCGSRDELMQLSADLSSNKQFQRAYRYGNKEMKAFLDRVRESNEQHRKELDAIVTSSQATFQQAQQLKEQFSKSEVRHATNQFIMVLLIFGMSCLLVCGLIVLCASVFWGIMLMLGALLLVVPTIIQYKKLSECARIKASACKELFILGFQTDSSGEKILLECPHCSDALSMNKKKFLENKEYSCPQCRKTFTKHDFPLYDELRNPLNLISFACPSCHRVMKSDYPTHLSVQGVRCEKCKTLILRKQITEYEETPPDNSDTW